MTIGLPLFLVLAAAVVVPAGLCWMVLRKSAQLQRGIAALVGGQLIVVPVMIYIASQESGPSDADAWGAVIGVSLIALFGALLTLWAFEQVFGGDNV